MGTGESVYTGEQQYAQVSWHVCCCEVFYEFIFIFVCDTQGMCGEYPSF